MSRCCAPSSLSVSHCAAVRPSPGDVAGAELHSRLSSGWAGLGWAGLTQGTSPVRPPPHSCQVLDRDAEMMDTTIFTHTSHPQHKSDNSTFQTKTKPSLGERWMTRRVSPSSVFTLVAPRQEIIVNASYFCKHSSAQPQQPAAPSMLLASTTPPASQHLLELN